MVIGVVNKYTASPLGLPQTFYNVHAMCSMLSGAAFCLAPLHLQGARLCSNCRSKVGCEFPQNPPCSRLEHRAWGSKSERHRANALWHCQQNGHNLVEAQQRLGKQRGQMEPGHLGVDFADGGRREPRREDHFGHHTELDVLRWALAEGFGARPTAGGGGRDVAGGSAQGPSSTAVGGSWAQDVGVLGPMVDDGEGDAESGGGKGRRGAARG